MDEEREQELLLFLYYIAQHAAQSSHCDKSLYPKDIQHILMKIRDAEF